MGAFTYPRTEPGSGGHGDLVEKLHTFVNDLERELEGLTEETVSRRPTADDWSIKDIVGHLCDHAHHFHTRLFRMIKQEEPRLPAWNETEAWKERSTQSASLADLLREFAAQRYETTEMMADLVHWNWARTGRHEELGRISIRQLVDRAIAHDEAHLQQIRQLKSAS